MTYMINARLEQGAPSLTLIDAKTGEERLHWRANDVTSSTHDLQQLFKRLMLLSCADKICLVQRAQSPAFGDECLDCFTCKDQNNLDETYLEDSRLEENHLEVSRAPVFSKQSEQQNMSDKVVSLFPLTEFPLTKK